MTDSEKAAREIVDSYLGEELKAPFDDIQDFYCPSREDLKERIRSIIDKYLC